MCNLGVAPWLAGPKLHEAEKHRKNPQEDFLPVPPRTAPPPVRDAYQSQ